MIRLVVFLKVIFAPYYDPSPPSREAVVNSMYSLWNFPHYKNGCIFRAVCSLLQELTYTQWFTRLSLVQLVTQVTRGLTDMETSPEVLT